MELINLIRGFSDENRARIINLLSKKSLCVGEIQYILNINQSNASRHLNKLKNLKIVVFEKKAQWIYYKLNTDLINKYEFFRAIIEKDFKNEEILAKDFKKLEEYKGSNLCCEKLRKEKLI